MTELGANEGGRPTKYQAKYAKQAYKLCLLGATDEDLAEFFEVAVSTVNLWKLEHAQFSEALKSGKTQADMEVADALRRRALGFEYMDTDIRVVDGKVVKTRIKRAVPADTTAGIFWLKNRQKKDWRDKQEQEVEVHGNMTVETVSFARSKQEPSSDADRPADNPD